MAKTPKKDDLGVHVRIEGEALAAHIQIANGFNPEQLTVDFLDTLLRQDGVQVTKNVVARLEQLIKAYKENPKSCDVVVAKAVLPKHGVDGELIWEPEFDPESETNTTTAKDASGDDDAVDFYSQGHYKTVAEGDHVATLKPPTAGTEGRNISGGVIKAKPGKTAKVKFDASLKVNEKGHIIAQNEGLLRFHLGQMSVSPVFEVKECVDFTTGNIDFDGAVTIREGVRDRFEVKASGDIVIQGLIEAATIICGGNLECRRGMAAKDKGRMIIDGDAEIGFLNNVHGEFRGDLNVRKEILNSELIIGKNLRCERGPVIGGTTKVTGSLLVMTLGNEVETPTLIVLGSMPLITSRIAEINKACPEWKEQLERLEYEQGQMSAGRGAVSPQLQERLTELNFEVADLQSKLKEAEVELTALEAELAQKSKVEVRVEKCIFPKVRLHSGECDFLFTQILKGPVKIGWNERKQLVYRQGDGRVQRLNQIARERPLAA